MSTIILVFGFNRPDHLKQTLSKLDSANYFTRLPIIINIDGPRSVDDTDLVNQCLNVAESFRKTTNSTDEIRVCRARTNKGLARSITETITNQFHYFDSVLVVEDDILLDPHAIHYFEKQIKLHKDNPSIQSVSLFTPSNEFVEVPFLSPRMMCWGWGTWKHKWKDYLPKASCQAIFRKHPGLKNYYSRFVGLDSYSTLQKCLFDGKDVWACRWILSHVLNQSFCLIPPKSLSMNIGLDGTGQNCGAVSAYTASSFKTSLKDIENWTRAKPLESVHLMQLFAANYDKNALDDILDRNADPFILV